MKQPATNDWCFGRESARGLGDSRGIHTGRHTQLKSLAKPDTIICRCEDVARGRLAGYDSWHAAKFHTRCGMGACQGRVCGDAVAFLFGWKHDSVWPPIFPARVESLAHQHVERSK